MPAVHYRELENEDWPLQYFDPGEFGCNHCGIVQVGTAQRDAWERLDAFRADLGYPLRVHSATRCNTHNKAVGGAKNSQHLPGLAFDVSVIGDYNGNSPAAGVKLEMTMVYLAAKHGFGGIGLYPNFMHLDTRPLRDGKPTIWFDVN